MVRLVKDRHSHRDELLSSKFRSALDIPFISKKGKFQLFFPAMVRAMLVVRPHLLQLPAHHRHITTVPRVGFLLILVRL